MVLSLDNTLVPEFISAVDLNSKKNIINSKDTSISIFGGTGFISSRFCELYKNKAIEISKDDYRPKSKNVLYFISTTNNANTFTSPQMSIARNLKTLINVLDKCKDKNIVFNFISSSLVYGECQKPANENSFCHPKGFYGISKKCAEDLLISYCKTFNISYRILRLGTVYGKSPFKSFEKINSLHLIIDRLKKNKLVKLHSSGDFMRDYIHINDAVRGINFAIDNSPVNSKINIASGVSYKFSDLTEKAKQIISSRSKIELCPATEFYKMDRVEDVLVDVNKLKSLGFQSNISIKEGIAQLYS